MNENFQTKIAILLTCKLCKTFDQFTMNDDAGQNNLSRDLPMLIQLSTKYHCLIIKVLS